MSKPAPPSYRTTNWPAYNAALRQRGSLLVWFDLEMDWLAVPRGRRGRPSTISDAAIQTCLTRDGRCSGCLCDRRRGWSRARLEAGGPGLAGAGLQHPMPAIERPECPDPLSPEHGRLAPSRRQHRYLGCWRGRVEHAQAWRLPAPIMAQGPSVHRREHAGGAGHRGHRQSGRRRPDAPRTSGADPRRGVHRPRHGRRRLTATRPCHAAIAARQAGAIIPTRRNAQPWKDITAGAEARNEILRATKRLGRAIWRSWSGHHRRSRIEAKMRCLKLLGERLMARTFGRQTTELHIRAALLNRFTRLGTPKTQRAALRS